MKYKDFEDAFSAARLNKYKNACSATPSTAPRGGCIFPYVLQYDGEGRINVDATNAFFDTIFR